MITNKKKIDFKAINQSALLCLPSLLMKLLPGGKSEGGEYVVCNPCRSDKRPGSFKINKHTGEWADFATGDKGGDPISLCAYVNNTSQSQAARLLSELLGRAINDFDHTKPPVRTAKNSRHHAYKIWQSASQLNGTIAEKYLHLRGLHNLSVLAFNTLRFHPSLYHAETKQRFPSLIAAAQHLDGKFAGIQRIYLDSRTQYKANIASNKKSLGSLKGGAVRFGNVRETIIVTEGVEDALTIFQACPDSTVWAGLGGNIASLEFPDEVQEVIIAMDNDEAGKTVSQKLASKLIRENRRVSLACPIGSKDFNGMIHGGCHE